MGKKISTRDESKVKIKAQSFSENTNQVLFDVTDKKTGEITPKTAAEIALDKDMLHELTPEEAHQVGYAAAVDQHNVETQQLESLRRDKKKARCSIS